jgi:hypothetical protein
MGRTTRLASLNEASMTDYPDRRRLMQGAALLAAASLLPTTTLATETTMTDDTGAHDFDFLFGAWNVHHRYLRGRLVGSNDWIAFNGTLRAAPLLGGFGNYDDNTLEKPEGFYRAVTLRAFDPAAKTWAIWFLDGRTPHAIGMPPMIGKFENRVGNFYCDDTNNGKPVICRFIWNAANPEAPTWEQALSPDKGRSWETNWRMTYTRTG